VTETVAPPGYQAAPPQSGIKLTLEITTVTLTFVDKTTKVGGEAHPINRVGILAPWLGLALLLIGGATWFALRRRTT
jgi:MprA protease rhombosortase-interaction domain-containing protein